MSLSIECLEKDDWAELSEAAHLVVFGKLLPLWKERIDFALVAKDAGGNLVGYLTAREHDGDTLYWVYGGAFPGSENSVLVYRAYEMGKWWAASSGYKTITTRIENTNTRMLRLAMKLGFRVNGVITVDGSIFLEHALDLQN